MNSPVRGEHLDRGTINDHVVVELRVVDCSTAVMNASVGDMVYDTVLRHEFRLDEILPRETEKGSTIQEPRCKIRCQGTPFRTLAQLRGIPQKTTAQPVS